MNISSWTFTSLYIRRSLFWHYKSSHWFYPYSCSMRINSRNSNISVVKLFYKLHGLYHTYQKTPKKQKTYSQDNSTNSYYHRLIIGYERYGCSLCLVDNMRWFSFSTKNEAAFSHLSDIVLLIPYHIIKNEPTYL